jgi:hypothetical protein
VLLAAGYSDDEVKQLLDEGAACAARDTCVASNAQIATTTAGA